jgi:hypothetical protein
VIFNQTSGSCSIPCVTATIFSNVSINALFDITPVGAVVANYNNIIHAQNNSKTEVIN